MKIIVEYDSEILGSGIFWQGDEKDIEQIRNIVAKIYAKELISRGFEGTLKVGMWTVKGVKDEKTISSNN